MIQTMVIMDFEKNLRPMLISKFYKIFSKYKYLKIQNLITIGCEPSKDPFYSTLMYLKPLDTLTIMYKDHMGEVQQRGKNFVKVDLEDPIYSA
jgi:hypothetical protein